MWRLLQPSASEASLPSRTLSPPVWCNGPMPLVERSCQMPVDAATAACWHFRAAALARCMPPWRRWRLVSGSAEVIAGSTVELDLRCGPRWRRQLLQRELVRPGVGFTQRQLSGPLREFIHSRRFLIGSEGLGVREDRVRFEVSRLPLLSTYQEVRFRHEFARILAFSQQRASGDLARHASDGSATPRRIGITGSTGLVGTAACAFFAALGHEVVPFLRPTRRAAPGVGNGVIWDPLGDELSGDGAEGLDAVIHLAGASIAARPWTRQRRALLTSSRVSATASLCSALSRLRSPPRVVVCASGINFYGSDHTIDAAPVDESGAPGAGFLAELARSWESALAPAVAAGIRAVRVRIGMVVSARGGAVARMATPARLGLLGPLGSGRQAVSWIHIDDLLGILHRAAIAGTLEGAVNAVAPGVVSQAEFAQLLAGVFDRPAFLRTPRAVVSAGLGDLGRELLLGGVNARSAVLADGAFNFEFASLDRALRFEYGRFDEIPAPALLNS